MNQTLKDVIGVGIFIFIIYLFFGSIWPRLFPNIKMMGDEHDLFASESPIIEHPSVKTKSLDENTIKQHLIGKELKNAKWRFASLREFEHFEIESVSTNENQDKTYIIKSVLKDWKADKRYNSRFYITYDKVQGQSAIKDALLGERMILEVAAYSFELIVPEKDLPSENDNTSEYRDCPVCRGLGVEDNRPCTKCNSNRNCQPQGSGGYKALGMGECGLCSKCQGRGVFSQTCRKCNGNGRITKFE